ncbi:MAG: B12-binding domain-containing radical SAM protein [Desulfobacterales bacterium]|nr:B12-binding domain-containing radical SAM protein [Desulfobacterales bacterium]
MKKRRKPARMAPVDEQGAIVKRGRGLIKVALVYPNTYKAGMSSLGFQTVYRLANRNENVACERVFLPDTREKSPAIKSLETGLPLDQFDMILFSISFENDFLHLAKLLRATGIPLRSSDRNHIHPLVVAGGVACFLNPEPIAPFVDLFLLGEAECLLQPFFDIYQKAKNRESLLSGVETRMKGAYVPANHSPLLYGEPASPPGRIEVQYLSELSEVKTTTAIMTSGTAFKDIFLIETLKGCPHGCRFCTAGYIYRPPRIYPLDTLKEAIDEAAGKTDKLGLVSSAVLDHPDIGQICQYGKERGMRLSFSSLRADKLDDNIISILSGSGVKTATIAPEAGSKRMRSIINKKLTREQILKAAGSLVDKGIINLRLYFMIGLPFETAEDVQAIVDLTREIKSVFLDASRKKKKIGTITLSINPFIPKPCTPFQWSAMNGEKELKKRVAIIRNGLKRTANVTLNFESLRQAKTHALLSLGDRKAADLIELALEHGWTRAMKMEKAYCDLVIYKEKSRDPAALLPWNILSHRVADDFLLKEYFRAKDEKISASCPMKPCADCRICIR